MTSNSADVKVMGEAMLSDPTASPRVEGRPKVTGVARYPAEMTLPGMLHAALVVAPIASGRILSIDAAAATRMPGFVKLLTHENMPRLERPGIFLFLQDSTVHFAGQPVALAIAETPELARAAAEAVRVEYETATPRLSLDAALSGAFAPATAGRVATDSRRGDPEAALRSSDVVLERRYTTPTNNHLPIEPPCVIAHWTDDRVVVHATTQAVFAHRAALATCLKIAPEQLRIICKYIGGGFGAKGSTWFPGLLLGVAAARDLGRPLKFELTRAQMFTLIGRRQETIQDLRIGATQAGKLTAIVHDTVAQTSTHSDYADPTATVSRMLYACPNVATSHRLVRLNAPHPCPMRAPGEGPGSFALESALDELAYQLDLDPIELRLRNQAGRDQHVDRPWSSNGLKACLATAAHAFGWDKRPSRIRTLREGSLCIGMGMATACYPYYSLPSEAVVALSPEGRISVRCATQDMGSGTYTALSQLVANELGVSPSDVEVELGDSDLPEGPYSGGSMATASFAPAVTLAAQNLKSKLLATATTDAESVLHGANPNELVVGRGYVSAPRTNRAESFADLLRRSGDIAREGHARTVPDAKPQFSAYAFGAVFAEVGVDEELGQVWVRRITAAYAAGKIINPLLARSQYVGGLIGGVGMALHEQTIMDQRLGHVMNDNMADYLIPVHADMPEFDIHIVQEDDPHLPGGVKGIGMLGTVGTAAAIANAVYHATGRRIRDLPIRTEQFL